MKGKGSDTGLLLQSSGTTAHNPLSYQDILGDHQRCDNAEHVKETLLLHGC